MSDVIDFAGASNEIHVCIMGVGGAGISAMEALRGLTDIGGIKFIAVDTDAAALERSNAQFKLQIGAEQAGGMGTGENAELARKAVSKSRRELKDALNGVDLAVLICGLGGGMGAGAVPEIVELANGMRIQSLVIASLPYSFEGEKRMQRAEETVAELRENGRPVFVVPNENNVEQGAENFDFLSGYAAANEQIQRLVSALLRLVTPATQAATVGLGFADLCSVLNFGGVLHFAEGCGTGEAMCLNAVQEVEENAALGTSLRGANSLAVFLTLPSDASLMDAESGLEHVRSIVDADAEITLGFQHRDDLKDEVRVTVLASTRPQLPQAPSPAVPQNTEESELDALASLFRGEL